MHIIKGKKTAAACGAVIIALLSGVSTFAQSYEELSPEEIEIIEEMIRQAEEEENGGKVIQKTPQGWRFTPLPMFSYNSDLGLKLGASVDIFSYGKDPSIFPDYYHRFRTEASFFTRGQALIHSEYDSSHLIPVVRFSVSATYQNNPLCNFYGFGGDVTEYDRSKDLKDGVAYYSYRRKMARLITTFQGKIVSNLNWVAGVSAWYLDTSESDFKDYDGNNSLYHLYRTSGIIEDDEIKGGVIEFKAGLSWDTRDFEPSPSKGIYADVSLNASPDFFRTGYKYAKLSAHFRHYFTPGPDWLTLAYHVAYQGLVAGKAPFYVQQNIYSLILRQPFNEGLGGPNTIRGVLTSRLIGNGYAWGNFEARIRLFSLNWLGVDWYVATNPFYDIGAIVQPYKIDEIAAATGEPASALLERSSHLHQSAGLGLKIGMDRNFILSIEAAKAFNKNDGPLGLTIAVNYIF